MLSVINFIFSVLISYLKVLRPGGVRALVAENAVLKQQLILIRRNRKRASKLTTIERTLFGFITGFITRQRLSKVALILSPATLLKYHKALVKRKYRRLFSNKTAKKPGPKGPSQELIALILEMKQRNPRFGILRITRQINNMFNKIISTQKLPKYLSSDHDPLFKFHRWRANLRILDIAEIKSIPYEPQSHPFIERVIGTIRREYLNHMFFWNKYDLKNKLDAFQFYYNQKRAHAGIRQETPSEKYKSTMNNVVDLNNYSWKSHARGTFQLPVAA